MNLISEYIDPYTLIKFIDHNADRSGLPLLVKKRLKSSGRTMGWIGYITSYMFYFTVSRDGKFSNMLRNDPKVERKKGSSLLALRLSFLSTWQVSYCAIGGKTNVPKEYTDLCAQLTKIVPSERPTALLALQQLSGKHE